LINVAPYDVQGGGESYETVTSKDGKKGHRESWRVIFLSSDSGGELYEEIRNRKNGKREAGWGSEG